MPLPQRFGVSNWTATLTCGASGAQQVANLGGMLTEFKAPEIKQNIIKKKFCGTGGVTPIPTGTFEELECSFKMELTSVSAQAAGIRAFAGAATLVLTYIGLDVNSIETNKTGTWTLIGQVEKFPLVYDLKAQELGEGEFSMCVTDISMTWDGATDQFNPIKFEVMDGLTNLSAALKTGMGI